MIVLRMSSATRGSSPVDVAATGGSGAAVGTRGPCCACWAPAIPCPRGTVARKLPTRDPAVDPAIPYSARSESPRTTRRRCGRRDRVSRRGDHGPGRGRRGRRRSCGRRWPATAWPTPCSPPATRSWPSSTPWWGTPRACRGATWWSSTWTSTWASGPTTRPASSGGSGSGSWSRPDPGPPTTSTGWPARTRSASATPGCCACHPLDLCCLGIGENGHLAFNDPPVADFDDPADVKVVELDAGCRRQQVDEGHFPDRRRRARGWP